MRKLYAFFLTFSLITIYGRALPKKRVCVIGAGRSGLAAIKLVADQIDHFEVVAFERNSDVGGLWIYREDAYLDEHGLPAPSGIYKHLKTNIPKEFMAYPDYPHFDGEETSDIVSHKMVVEYMRNYTHHFQLYDYIQLDTLVTKVIPTQSQGDWRSTTWRIEVKNLNTHVENATNCDAVIVCNGHFSKPNLPKISGIETFPGRVLHSRFYRRPENYSNETVVVLGAGDSGIDISLDLSNYAKKVYISHRHETLVFSGELPANVQESRGVVSVKGNELTLQDNSIIHADTFIFCTGFLYDFPFLDERSGIVVGRKTARPLYEQLINVEHPTMAFVGLTVAIDYAQLYYEQTKRFLELLQGKQELPSYKEMLKESKKWWVSILFFLAIFHGEALAKKRVCVIGAGRSGLAAIKSVADRSDNFDVVAFERKSDVGGLWIYTDSTNLDEHGLPVQTTVYKNLKINLPRGWMVYPDFEVFNDPENRVNVPHTMFLDYMRNYTDEFDLRKYIKFNTLVTKVFPIKRNGDWTATTWQLETRDLNSNKGNATICDAVMVCTGIYNKPNIPKIPGIETFTGQILHSRSYKKPEDFTNKTVVLLGAGISGLDIAKDLNDHAKVIYLSHRNYVDPFTSRVRPTNVRVVRGVVAAKNGKLILQDNSTIVADTLIYCTGFLLDFPFLDKRSGIAVEKKYIRPLIEESVNKNNPSMCFLGLEDNAFFGSLCLAQVWYSKLNFLPNALVLVDIFLGYANGPFETRMDCSPINQLKNNQAIMVVGFERDNDLQKRNSLEKIIHL